MTRRPTEKPNRASGDLPVPRSTVGFDLFCGRPRSRGRPFTQKHLDHAAVHTVGRQVARAIEKPEAFPLVQQRPQIF